MRFGKLYIRFIKVYMKSRLEYRFSLVVELLANLILIGVHFSGIFIIYSNFSNIVDWDIYEFIFLFTTNWMSYSLSSFLFWMPMGGFGNLLRSGEFDSYLIRPLNPLIHLVIRQFQYTFIPRLLLAIIFWGYSIGRVHIDWSIIKVVYLLLTIISGFFICSGIFIVTGSVSFWTIQSTELTSLLTNNDYGLRTYVDYPLTMFNKKVQFLLSFVVPYAFTGFYQVVFLLDKDPGGIGQSIFQWAFPLIALIIFSIALQVWKQGIKKYGSTGN